MNIGIGLIGLGGITQKVHIPDLLNAGHLTIVAICDIDPEALESTRSKLGLPADCCFEDYRDLIACNEVDAVVIATPNHLHVEMALETVAAGKSYCVEKPLGLCARETAPLVKATQEAGVKSMVCFSYRYKAAARMAREMIRRGDIGKIHHISMQYLQTWGNEEADCPLVWRFRKEYAGTGVLGDLGSHMVDFATFLTGRRFIEVTAQAATLLPTRRGIRGDGVGQVDVDDFCNFLADMEDGISASFQTTRVAYGRGNYQRFEIYGSCGALVYMLDADGGEVDTLEVCIGRAMSETGSFKQVTIPEKYRTNQMRLFEDLLLGREDGCSATVQDGYESMCVLDAIERSFNTRQWVSL